MSTCRGCKKAFTPKRKGQGYHNIKCYRKSTIKLIECPECGDNFQKNFSRQVCCTTKCSFSYRAKKNTKKVIVRCYSCDKTFYKIASKVRKFNFCNNSCKIAYLKSPQNTSMSKGWKHTDEAKKKISKAGTGRKPTKENIEKLKVANRNRIWSKEMRISARLRKLGKPNTEEQNRKIKAHAKYGIDNIMWKGDFASYYAWHLWVNRHKGKAKAQECIDKILWELPCSKKMEWSNVDHKYRRSLDEYEPRCTLHHRIYDIINLLTNQTQFLPHSVYRFLVENKTL